jgi:hypothetical protein
LVGNSCFNYATLSCHKGRKRAEGREKGEENNFFVFFFKQREREREKIKKRAKGRE